MQAGNQLLEKDSAVSSQPYETHGTLCKRQWALKVCAPRTVEGSAKFWMLYYCNINKILYIVLFKINCIYTYEGGVNGPTVIGSAY